LPAQEVALFMCESRSRLDTGAKDQEIQSHPYISKRSVHDDTSFLYCQ
jgi:hypothetical protein